MTTNDTNTTAQPGKNDVPALTDLLAAITDENLHPEVDTGEPVGVEVW
jgi:antitoxin component of MazEF toxin-antitoxin module